MDKPVYTVFETKFVVPAFVMDLPPVDPATVARMQARVTAKIEADIAAGCGFEARRAKWVASRVIRDASETSASPT